MFLAQLLIFVEYQNLKTSGDKKLWVVNSVAVLSGVTEIHILWRLCRHQ